MYYFTYADIAIRKTDFVEMTSSIFIKDPTIGGVGSPEREKRAKAIVGEQGCVASRSTVLHFAFLLFRLKSSWIQSFERVFT